jgi:YHS domain-containing protein
MMARSITDAVKCVERIPKDKKVREAVDPYTGKTVDKASAYIVMISNEGKWLILKNEENYKKFLAQNS